MKNFDKEFLLACKDGDVEGIIEYLDKGANIESRDNLVLKKKKKKY